MSIFGTPTPAPVPKTKDVTRISFFYAAIIVVMVVAQLFTFDSFLSLLLSFDLPGGDRTAITIGALLVAAEVFALPFLLKMTISPAFRWFSLLCAGLVADIWIFLSLWVVLTDSLAENIGFLGTVVGMMPGWWSILISLSFGILAVWAAWGMWPLSQRPKKAVKRPAVKRKK